ncbi:MAG: hypothetical protein N4A74_05740 [Carboxylicivirga sp.]|nr:hypothetical protein [Carboxylicivirga sp.]
MRFILFTTLLISISFQSFAQLTSVVTSKEKEALNQYQNFILVDQATQYVLAKEPVKYEVGKNMPCCYFSSVIPAETGVTYASDYRSMAINTIVGADKEKWVICKHKEEGKTMFAQRRFLADFKVQYLWVPIIDGNYVLFLNLQGVYRDDWRSYLTIDPKGNYITVKEKSQASRWKLIYNE